jgi:hypothetical protein
VVVVHVVELPLGDGTVLLVEAVATDDQEPPGIDRVGRARDVTHRAAETLQAALQNVRPALAAIVGQIRDIGDSPDTITVQFGITVSAQAGVVVAQAATEANFTITAEWRR